MNLKQSKEMGDKARRWWSQPRLCWALGEPGTFVSFIRMIFSRLSPEAAEESSSRNLIRKNKNTTNHDATWRARAGHESHLGFYKYEKSQDEVNRSKISHLSRLCQFHVAWFIHGSYFCLTNQLWSPTLIAAQPAELVAQTSAFSRFSCLV